MRLNVTLFADGAVVRRWRRRTLLACTIVVAYGLSACAAPTLVHQERSRRDVRFAMDPGVSKVAVRGGIACIVYGEIEPASYLVRDLGRSGVPTPSRHDRNTIARITRYFFPRTLRFTYAEGQFVVFNAKFGACWGGVPGYFVLNGSCNATYKPVQGGPLLGAVPDCWKPRRPWIENDIGLENGTATALDRAF